MRILLAAAGTPSRSGRRSAFVPIVTLYTQHLSLTLSQLAAITPTKHSITIVDENNGQQVDCIKDYDVVAISSFTKHVYRAYELADAFRAQGVTVVLGGYHPSALPEEAQQHADAVVIGEAEHTWLLVLNDIEQGSLKPLYRQEEPIDPAMIPPARRDASTKKITADNIQATRGCPYRCEFCSVVKVEGYRFRARPIEAVIAELRQMKTKSFSFNDSSLTIDPGYSKDLFRAMRGLGKRFRCFGNINTLYHDEDLVRLSHEAGCQAWHIGFESVCQESLNDVKKANDIRLYQAGIKKIKQSGVGAKGLFMFGFDCDTPSIFADTYRMIRGWNLDSADFAILTPYPGTPLYQRLEQEGRIRTRDWSLYNLGNVVFTPKLMTPEELYTGWRCIANAFHSWPSLCRRMLRNDAHGIPGFIDKLFGNLWDKKILITEQGL